MSEHEHEKTPRYPAEGGLDFWRNEARIAAEALEASRRENIEIERHYRAALVALVAASEFVAECHTSREDWNAFDAALKNAAAILR